MASMLVTFDISRTSALMVKLNEVQVATIGESELRTIQQNNKQKSYIDADLRVFLEIFVIPDTYVKSNEGAVCLLSTPWTILASDVIMHLK